MKVTIMDNVKSYNELEGKGTVLREFYRGSTAQRSQHNQEAAEKSCLPKIQCIVATKSAEAGINSKFLEFGIMDDLPSPLYGLIQQLGRLDRE